MTASASTGAADVTVIIATVASPARKASLRRAVASVRESSARPVRLIVVVNGSQFDPATCEWLRQQPDIRFVQRAQPSLPAALYAGRCLVETAFYSTLDDDDEYLPGATDLKLEVLRARPDAALVVTNGFRSEGATQQLAYADLSAVPASPLDTLFDFTWLHNCNALYRSALVGASYFEDGQAMAEWTWLAYRISIDRLKVAVLDVPTFRYNDTPASLSKSDSYLAGQLSLLRRMLACSPSKRGNRLIRRRIGDVHHHQSTLALASGHAAAAWRSHLLSLTMPGGLRYFFYGRRLLPGYALLSGAA